MKLTYKEFGKYLTFLEQDGLDEYWSSVALFYIHRN